MHQRRRNLFFFWLPQTGLCNLQKVKLRCIINIYFTFFFKYFFSGPIFLHLKNFQFWYCIDSLNEFVQHYQPFPEHSLFWLLDMWHQNKYSSYCWIHLLTPVTNDFHYISPFIGELALVVPPCSTAIQDKLFNECNHSGSGNSLRHLFQQVITDVIIS